MRSLRSISCLLAGFALAAVLFSSLGPAASEDEEAHRATPQADVVARVRRALVGTGGDDVFHLVVVVQDDDLYVESYGELEEDDARVVAHKLHALAELCAAHVEEGFEHGDEDDDAHEHGDGDDAHEHGDGDDAHERGDDDHEGAHRRGDDDDDEEHEGGHHDDDGDGK